MKDTNQLTASQMWIQLRQNPRKCSSYHANAPGEVRGQLVDEGTAVAAPAAGSITVTITNTSPYQPMTPPVVVLHNAPDTDNGMRLFYPTQPASESIIAIAENGNNAPLVNTLGYLCSVQNA